MDYQMTKTQKLPDPPIFQSGTGLYLKFDRYFLMTKRLPEQKIRVQFGPKITEVHESFLDDATFVFEIPNIVDINRAVRMEAQRVKRDLFCNCCGCFYDPSSLHVSDVLDLLGKEAPTFTEPALDKPGL